MSYVERKICRAREMSGEICPRGNVQGGRPKLESVDPTCLKGLVDHGPIDRR